MFIDLQKAYDTVPIKMLWKILQKTNINQTLIQVLKNLYDGSTSRVKIGNMLPSKLTLNKGLHQGCNVSPTLFKIHALYQWKRKCNGMGINIGDTCLYTLQQTIRLRQSGIKITEGPELTTGKTKYLPVGIESSNIQLETEEIEICCEYTYLGVEFTTTGKDNKKKFKKGITQIRCLNSIFWSHNIEKKRKINIHKTLIKSNLRDRAETWRQTVQN